jgi:hypothetical protein
MSRANPQMRVLAKRLLATETGRNKSSETRTAARLDVFEKLGPPLATLMGQGGFRAVLARSLALGSEEVPWLRAVHVKADGSFEKWEELQEQLNPNEFAEGKVVLLAQLIALLVAFIGVNLTLHLLRGVWPKVPFDDLDFDGGKK